MRLFRLPNSVRRVQRDVDDEIRFHLESRVADLVARGARPDVARDLAGQEFGDIGEARAELATVDRRRLTRERRADWWEGVRQDLSYSVRSLRKQPAFTGVVIVVLALGIGANATMFGVIDRLLLRPPAHVADPGRLMTVALVQTRDGEDGVQEVLSYPIYRDLRESRGTFDHVAAFAPLDLALGRGADARQVRGLSVTASYFRALGVRPVLGRFFAPEEDGNPSAPAVVVLGYRSGERSSTATLWCSTARWSSAIERTP